MKKVQFYPMSARMSAVVPMPKPASEYTPEWFDSLKMFDGGEPVLYNGVVQNRTVKSCAPFGDSFRMGWIQETWCDITFIDNGNSMDFGYSTEPAPIDGRPVSSFPENPMYYPMEFLWKQYWTPRLPAGYSLLYTHPLNHTDLPFHTVSAVVDSDSFYHSSFGNVPFHLREGFVGTIPAGTPMFQIIPIKREAWNREAMEFDSLDLAKRESLIERHFFGTYRRHFWKRKSYK